MRGTQVEGRFKIDWENKSMEEGMVDELRNPVGTQVDWYVFNPDDLNANRDTWIDPVYDVSNETGGYGLGWNNPLTIPVVMAQQIRGTNVMNERGRYTTDTLRLVTAVADLNRLLPDALANPNGHIRDRVVFQGEVFIPTRILPRGRYKNFYSVVTLDLNQCNPEELVNFQQFLSYAN